MKEKKKFIELNIGTALDLEKAANLDQRKSKAFCIKLFGLI